jgi:hypothetical protein
MTRWHTDLSLVCTLVRPAFHFCTVEVDDVGLRASGAKAADR